MAAALRTEVSLCVKPSSRCEKSRFAGATEFCNPLGRFITPIGEALLAYQRVGVVRTQQPLECGQHRLLQPPGGRQLTLLRKRHGEVALAIQRRRAGRFAYAHARACVTKKRSVPPGRYRPGARGHPPMSDSAADSLAGIVPNMPTRLHARA
jgi:hypothetical protein